MPYRSGSSIAPLLRIARCGIPFTAADGQAFVRLDAPSSGGFFILPVRSRAYRDWFFHQFFAEYDSIPTSHAFHAVLDHLEAQANQSADNQRLAVWCRVGSRGPGPIPEQILLDLANSDREFVEISPQGWKVTTGANALFQASRPMVSLPAPVPSDPGPVGQALSPINPLVALRSCLNLPSRAAWLRCLAWLLAALRPHGPFPFLVLQGPPASGKTFAARLLRSLIDPCTSPLTPIPSSVRDVLSLARHNWVLAFDHISTLSPPLTEAFCRLSSGVGASLRETPGAMSEPLQQYFKRPVLLTVTDRWSCPAELAERALTVTLPPLPPEIRQTETALLTVAQQAFPAILGALCSAVSTALGRLPRMNLPSGRCADALAWAMAASPALGCTEEEIRQAFAPPPPPHPMVEAVRNLLEQRRRWTGTASQLLHLLQPSVSCRTPKGISQQLKSCTLTLADAGIELKFRRLHEGERIINLSLEPGDASWQSSLPDASPDSAPSPQPTQTEELPLT